MKYSTGTIYFEEGGDCQELQGIYTMMTRMIDRAVLDLKSKDFPVKRNAKLWLTSKDSADIPWSFKWVCQHLHVDGVALVRRLRRSNPEYFILSER